MQVIVSGVKYEYQIGLNWHIIPKSLAHVGAKRIFLKISKRPFCPYQAMHFIKNRNTYFELLLGHIDGVKINSELED